ncbi:MAG: hypothetical protein HZR80_21115 [Candidatus Heimdallarchaeota archaeon]
MSSSGPRYPGQSPHRVSKEDERKIAKMELQEKIGCPKFLFSSHGRYRCPDCFRILRALPKASNTRVWITKCVGDHCYLVDLTNGKGRAKYERIPEQDSRFIKRIVKI